MSAPWVDAFRPFVVRELAEGDWQLPDSEEDHVGEDTD